MYVEVVFPIPIDKAFTYSVPPALADKAEVGVRVVAPFGKRALFGYVVARADRPSTDEDVKIKPIESFPDDRPLFEKTDLEFHRWLADHYLASLGEALKLADPTGAEIKTRVEIFADVEEAARLFAKAEAKKTTRDLALEYFASKEKSTTTAYRKAIPRRNAMAALKELEDEGVVVTRETTAPIKGREKKLKHARVAVSLDEMYDALPEIEARSQKQVAFLLKLAAAPNREAPLAEINAELRLSTSSISSLEKRGLIEVEERTVERVYAERYAEDPKAIELTDEQRAAIDDTTPAIVEGVFEARLLKGVTGGGKTQVYLELAAAAREAGKSAMILVPEISLTPQMTARLINRFKDDVAVLHSRMSDGERADSWRRILRGDARVVTGPRSALFAPLRNLGVIVVDEEHDGSYKQNDKSPRYHARDAAAMRARMAGCPIVFGSATPSIESYYNAKAGKYRLLELTQRVDDAKLPKIEFVNVGEARRERKMTGLFSEALLAKIDDRLRKREGVILLQNRRGFSTTIYCKDCGEIVFCEECDVSMVYHINENELRCHYCGAVARPPRTCPACESRGLLYFGAGSERVEDELTTIFPEARVERVDSDSIGRKGRMGEILNRFKAGEIDVLVGTQMVAKGLDFSRVTLAAVVSAETSLWLPDFRADERAFQLVTQLAGRAGRSKTPGEVIVQTENDRRFPLIKAAENDYEGFYRKEIGDRERLGYPPFAHLCLIEGRDKDRDRLVEGMEALYESLAEDRKWIAVSPPTPAATPKIKGEYRFHILVRTSRAADPNASRLRQSVRRAANDEAWRERYGDLRVVFDVNPYSVT